MNRRKKKININSLARTHNKHELIVPLKRDIERAMNNCSKVKGPEAQFQIKYYQHSHDYTNNVKKKEMNNEKS